MRADAGSTPGDRPPTYCTVADHCDPDECLTNVMSTSSPQRRSIVDSIRESLRDHFRRVDHACRARWGISGMVWRALDQVVSLGALILAGYAIDQGGDPVLALTLAMVIISGPKLAEWWLVREDYVDYEEVQAARENDD